MPCVYIGFQVVVVGELLIYAVILLRYKGEDSCRIDFFFKQANKALKTFTTKKFIEMMIISIGVKLAACEGANKINLQYIAASGK